jgi:hypothetical protein
MEINLYLKFVRTAAMVKGSGDFVTRERAEEVRVER